jgi:DNA (cytosine-5)-methyltransferase 1
LTELIATFQAQGYAVEKRWQVLNAAHYGVPQSRERLILFGAKKGLRIPKYPIPSNTLVNCKDALSDLPDADKFASLFEADEIKLALREFRKPSKYAQKMRCLSNNAWEYGYRRVWDPQILTSSMRTEHTAISRRRFSETKEGEVEPISRFFKLPSNGLSNTLRAGTDGSRGAFTSPRPIHYRYNRCVTVREMARLHGFPDWFRLHATKWHGAREIGNAVPPPLAKAIGCSIMAALNRKPIRPTEDLSLGNVDLLRLNLKAAAKYWGIEKPNGRRDRKSGAKKRRQDQIELELQAQLFAAE